jgi:hypothetical protein
LLQATGVAGLFEPVVCPVSFWPLPLAGDGFGGFTGGIGVFVAVTGSLLNS